MVTKGFSEATGPKRELNAEEVQQASNVILDKLNALNSIPESTEVTPFIIEDNRKNTPPDLSLRFLSQDEPAREEAPSGVKVVFHSTHIELQYMGDLYTRDALKEKSRQPGSQVNENRWSYLRKKHEENFESSPTNFGYDNVTPLLDRITQILKTRPSNDLAQKPQAQGPESASPK
jgi:hypothetical protein